METISRDTAEIYNKYLTTDIDQVEQMIEQYTEYKKEYTNLSKSLKELPNEIEYDITVPIGSLAFMPGKLIHTNEILVLLGDNWFVERSGSQASEIAKRRAAYVTQKLEDLQEQLKMLKLKANPNKMFEYGAEKTNEVNDDGEPIFEIREKLEDGEEDSEEKYDTRETVTEGLHLGDIKERAVDASVSEEDKKILDALDQFILEENAADDDDNDDASDNQEDNNTDEGSDDSKSESSDIFDEPISSRDMVIDSEKELASMKAHVAESNSGKTRGIENANNVTRGKLGGILTPESSKYKKNSAKKDTSRPSSSVSFNKSTSVYEFDKYSSPRTGIKKGEDEALKVHETSESPISNISNTNTLVIGGIKEKGIGKEQGLVDSMKNVSIKDKAPENKPHKIIRNVVKENETQEYDQDMADQDFLLREISQTYSVRRRQLLLSGKLDGMAEIAEKALKEVPGLKFKDELPPDNNNDDDDDDDENQDDAQPGAQRIEQNRIQLLSDNEYESAKRPTGPPQIIASKDIAESSAQPVQQKDQGKKMSLFKMKRMGLA
ncbi:hypothetical protein H4219_000532 [Mycoemilia scoparia]|uniref:Unconventional prefoldin RPB5 interactor n=1 Tax=Mycoemilia scoparia TaxID=417184 RepID=A0A9W8A601_9FUNG|nr:hypothetical protein H4219_000532 [Mycoemilia scoparia]